MLLVRNFGTGFAGEMSVKFAFGYTKFSSGISIKSGTSVQNPRMRFHVSSVNDI